MQTIFLLPDKTPFVEKLTRWLVTKSGGRPISVTSAVKKDNDVPIVARLLMPILVGYKQGVRIFNDVPADAIQALAVALADYDVIVLDVCYGEDSPEINLPQGTVCVIDSTLSSFDLFQRMEAVWKLASEGSTNDGDKPKIPGR